MVLVPLDPVVPLVPPEPEVPSVPAVVVVVVVVVVESASVLLAVTDSAPLLTLLMRGGDGLSNLTDLVDLVMGGDGGLPHPAPTSRGRCPSPRHPRGPCRQSDALPTKE